MDKQDVGRIVLRYMAHLTNEAVKYRTEINAFPNTTTYPTHNEHGSIYDMFYDDWVSEPIAAVKKLYLHFNLPYTIDFEHRMEAYLAQNPKVMIVLLFYIPMLYTIFTFDFIIIG